MKRLRQLPIGAQMLLLALSTILVMIAILAVVYGQISRVIVKNNREYTGTMFTQIQQSLSSNCTLFNRVLLELAYNSEMQDFLMEEDIVRRFELHRRVKKFASTIQGLNDGIVDLALVGVNGNSYYHYGRTPDVEQMVESLRGIMADYCSESRVLFAGRQSRRCFFIAKPIFSISTEKRPAEKIGIIAVVLDSGVLGLDVDEMPPEAATKFYLLDRNDTVYSSNDRDRIGATFDTLDPRSTRWPVNTVALIDGRRSILQIDAVAEIGGVLVSITPQDELLRGLSDSMRLVILVFAVCVGVSGVLFSLIMNNVLKPVGKFMQFMSRVRTGDMEALKSRIHVEGYAEIEVMGGEFNAMLDKVEVLTQQLLETSSRLYQAELETKRSEIAYLQSQVNPHFLSNTLETIKGIASRQKAAGIVEMAQALARVFRYSVKGAGVVTLREELEIIKAYLRIQQFRFGERIHVQFEIDPEAFECRVPKMILQPIVENAVSYGLEGKMGDGILVLGARIEGGDTLLIRVRDNGDGIEPGLLSDIRARMADARGESGERAEGTAHIGIINVNNRIRLAYGSGYGITITSTRSEGTEVVLRIPSGRSTDVPDRSR